MCDLREKLVNLIATAPVGPYHKIVDHLIANGVTIQRWIPVAERLPEKGIDCLCRCNIDGHDDFPFYMVLRYILIDKNPHFQHESEHGLQVTHWMEIPKEES